MSRPLQLLLVEDTESDALLLLRELQRGGFEVISERIEDLDWVPMVDASEPRLAQVFLNLIVNAAQAIPEGQVEANEIRIRTRWTDDGRVVVDVRDSGSGISEADLSRVLDPFFTTKPIGEGTGLGLSISHRTVGALKGTITVESKPGLGTVFRVSLPVATTRALNTLENEAPVVSARVGKVLVIDDEPVIGSVMKRMLAPQHVVHTAGRASGALARIIQGERFDVLFCDLMMPEITGMELHAELSKIAPDQADRMVFMTGGAFTTHAREFLDTVRNLKVDKPFDFNNLKSIVETVMSKAG